MPSPAPDVTRRQLADRVRALPVLLAHTPRWVLGGLGLLTTALGVFLLVRPLSALTILGVYVGISCVISGIGDLLGRREDSRPIELASGLIWILLGMALIVWLGRSLELLGPTVAAVLVIAGLGRLLRLFRDRRGRGVPAALFGLAEIAWGLVALLWPDATLLVVAVLFAIRTTAFGVSLLWRAGSGPRTSRSASSPPPPDGGQRRRNWPLAVRWVGAVLVLALGVGALYMGALFRQGVPVVDGFYAEPDTVPPEPGRLVRSEPYEGNLPVGLRAFRILYTTTGSDGSAALASGVLAVPDKPAGNPVPVIAWSHGTVGVARACAPSIGRNAITVEGMPSVDALARNGWAMVATDYTGMGAEGRFPYLIGQGEARSVLDSVRAAKQVPGVSVGNQTVVWGHSQGGHAALWSGQLAPSYAPDTNVVGTAALSPAANPLAMADVVTAHPEVVGASLGIAFVADAYSKTYADLPLAEIVAPSALTIVKEAAARCTSQQGTLFTILSGLAVSRDQPILRSDPASGPLGARLRENIPRGPWPAPLFIAQGSADEVIPIRLTEAFVPSVCSAGTTLHVKTYEGRNHMSVLAPGSPLNGDLEQWTKDRLAGKRAPDDCR